MALHRSSAQRIVQLLKMKQLEGQQNEEALLHFLHLMKSHFQLASELVSLVAHQGSHRLTHHHSALPEHMSRHFHSCLMPSMFYLQMHVTISDFPMKAGRMQNDYLKQDHTMGLIEKNDFSI